MLMLRTELSGTTVAATAYPPASTIVVMTDDTMATPTVDENRALMDCRRMGLV